MGRPKKVEKFRVTSFRNPGGTVAWRVSGSLNGKRVRENYPTKAAALERRGLLDLEALEIGHPYRMVKTHLTQLQVSDAEAAVALIGSIPLNRAVADYIRIRRALGLAKAKARRQANQPEPAGSTAGLAENCKTRHF